MQKKIALLCLFLLSGMGLVAHAGTIGPNCGSCFGSIYTLTDTPTGVANQYDVFLTVDTTGYTGASTNKLNSVALKLVSQDSQLASVSIVSAPFSFNNPVTIGGLNANGCSGNGGGFFCSQSSGPGVQVGSVYSFEYLVTLTSGSTFLTTDSVKALYVNAANQQAGITSEEITLDPTPPAVPEPSTFALLGTGLVGFAVVGRKLV